MSCPHSEACADGERCHECETEDALEQRMQPDDREEFPPMEYGVNEQLSVSGDTTQDGAILSLWVESTDGSNSLVRVQLTMLEAQALVDAIHEIVQP